MESEVQKELDRRYKESLDTLSMSITGVFKMESEADKKIYEIIKSLNHSKDYFRGHGENDWYMKQIVLIDESIRIIESLKSDKRWNFVIKDRDTGIEFDESIENMIINK